MSEWKEFKLGDITTFFSGGTPSKTNNKYWNGTIPWISAKTMTRNKVSFSDLNITEEGLLNGSRLANPTDILLLVRGSGLFIDIPINWVEKPLAFNQDIKAIRSKDPEIQEFLYYWLHGNKKGLYDILEETGIGAGKFDTELLKNLCIHIPTDKHELELITSTSKAIFDKIDLLHRNNKTLEQLAETLFRQWFVEEADESWEEVELRKVADVFRGLSYKGSGLTDKNDPKAVPMINLNSVFEGGGFKEIGTKYYNGKYRESHHLYPGELVITNTEQGHEHRLIGFTAIVPKSIGERGIFSQHIYKIVPKNGVVTSTYLNELFKTPSLRDQIIGATNGSTVNMLPAEGVLRCKVQIPPKEKMIRFSIIADDLLNKRESNNEQIKKLEILRDTLLPKLMNGTVRVTDIANQHQYEKNPREGAVTY